MAEQDGQEKSQEPTAKRLEDARRKGQVARSKEFNTFVMLVIAATFLLLYGKRFSLGLLGLMRQQLSLPRADLLAIDAPLEQLGGAIWGAVVLLLPFFGVMLVAAVIGPLVIGGASFSSEALVPKFDKLDPIKGLGRLFALRGLIELAKALAKFILIASVGWLIFRYYFPELIRLNTQPVATSITHVVSILSFSFLLLAASVLLIALVDAPYQLWEHNKQLKMTLQEVRDEAKDTDGNPEIKGRQRRIQMDMAQQRMMQEVPKADVIVTNPTHFAVALVYREDGEGAPKLVAKGVDLIALHIRKIAQGVDVPVVESPQLARALYHSTELNQEIPRGLFLAVAKVLAYVYQLRAARNAGWSPPPPPGDVPVPSEFAR
ncbi:MAG: flagellar biosynthesis protein FlhB [Methylococcales bacterium]|nr:flagellar biosynthesis protein FlhB [Methylococcales bacterium]